MIRALKAVSSERGRDPREYTLFAFGGNGPLFASGMARKLEMPRIVVPPAPGLFSSFGLLYGDVEHHYVRTYRRRTRQLDLDALNEIWRRMEAEALAQLAEEGFRGAATRLRRQADLSYQGQSFELTVPVPPGPLGPPSIAEIEQAFGREHERTYGHRAGPDEPVELVTLRLVAQGIPDHPRVPDRLTPLPVAGRGRGGADESRQVYFGPEHGRLPTPILRREDLATWHLGPCIVEEYDATCVIPPDARAHLDNYGNIVIEVTP
jgi:N-methylhydantoinase A